MFASAVTAHRPPTSLVADQKRWFKLWCSVLTDDDLQTLPPADRWAWAALGCHVKQAGTRGTASISLANAALAGALGIPLEALKATILRLPHIHVEEGKPDNDKLTVTYKNWLQYQEDRTVAERVARLRSKRRGEEEEKKRRTNPSTTPPLPQEPDLPVPPSILAALDRAPRLGAVPRLRSIAFWRASIRATNGHVKYAEEVLKAEAWLTANPTRAPRKDLARFMHNWLARAEQRP